MSLIALDEGARKMARFEGTEPDKVQIGRKVEARISILTGAPVAMYDLIQG